jgi:SAM-dependent methyltransferase
MPLTPGGTSFNYSGTELDSLSEAKNYYAWVMCQFEPWLGPTVIEAGAGIGTFSDFLLKSPKVQNLIAIEPAANTFPELERHFKGNDHVRTLSGYLSDYYRNLTANAVVAVNVLEHVEDHQGFLEEARAAVVDGGSLLLFVPALPAIYGSLDTVFEHYRRYTKSSLRGVIEAAGWKMQRVSYMNFPGIAAWFLAGRILRKTSVTARDAKTYDRLVVPWLSRLETAVPPPIGSNLVAIATKR